MSQATDSPTTNPRYSILTQARLREVLSYDPETGIFRWKVERGGVRIGQEAGSVRKDGDGYRRICVDRFIYRAHLLAWFWMTGVWPVRQIDHHDLDKLNNRWSNLRRATKSQNQANTPVSVRNASGLKGVSSYRAGESYGKPWQAGIQKDGRRIHIGHFATAEEAHAAYVAKARELFGEFARGG